MGGSSDAPTNGDTKSPKQSNSASPSRQDAVADSKQTDLMKPEGGLNSEVSKPLAPPPKPGQTQGNGTPDYFSSQAGGSLSLEPNPFEQSFGGGQPETPGGTKLPSVAALTSPSSLIPGTGTTPFNWPGGSLRTGPLSPAMLSGPTADYFGDHHIRGGFPTPNESSLRTGLTPGGSGSMFPAPSPNSALLAQLAGSGATPGTLDFHRTALSAKRELQNASKATATTQAPDASDVALPISKAEAKPASGPFDPHDNDAANGLYMLAQGRNGAQTSTQYPSVSQPAVHGHPAPIPPQALDTSPQLASINGGSVGSGSIRGASEVSAGSEESEQPKPTTRGKGRKNTNSTTTSSGRRKAEDAGTGRTPKKAKGNAGAAMTNGDFHSEDEDKDESTTSPTKSKMTDEEKRKNFLERNRVAALKCRQRKKQWLQNLQSKVEMYSAENENLTTQIGQLREEVVNLKTLLLAHKDCPVTQQQALQQGGVGPILQVVEPFNQLNPYGMATAIANGAVIGQPRRFS